MRENFVKVVEDRLILLNAYRTLHLTIPEASPLSGDLFLDLLKVTRYIENKTLDAPMRRVLTRSQEILDETVMGNLKKKFRHFQYTRFLFYKLCILLAEPRYVYLSF